MLQFQGIQFLHKAKAAVFGKQIFQFVIEFSRKDGVVAKVLIQAVHIVKQAGAGESGTPGLLRGLVVFEGADN